MSQLIFTVRSGSSDEIYTLEASRTGQGVRFSCSCQAGQNAMHCKHRAALLIGDGSAVVDLEDGALATLKKMVGLSPILPALEHAAKTEKAVADAQRDFKAAKKALAKAMMG